MDFNFNDEQQQFADALRRYLDKNYGFEARQAIVRSECGVSEAHWAAFRKSPCNASSRMKRADADRDRRRRC